MNEENRKGEINMNASVMKPSKNLPYATTKSLTRTPATRENREMIEYMDSHNFSISVDKNTMTIKTRAEKK
ncbi:hypothetical protein [Clostridium sp. HBUAS56010]|uniref:hypothetical protein n=1 Tax=Clostridium sp. HBUAS56010 TaxID=2571127 RepID=UPI0011782C4B|nr:hypothetical protein [Clostridium sp. HBUAS56010]